MKKIINDPETVVQDALRGMQAAHSDLLTVHSLAIRPERLRLVVTSGGVSEGDFDVVKEALSSLGSVWFGGVAMQPGKPQGFGDATAGRLDRRCEEHDMPFGLAITTPDLAPATSIAPLICERLTPLTSLTIRRAPGG